MLKKIAIFLGALALTIPGSMQANASPRQTKSSAVVSCMDYAKGTIINPQYIRRTRSGLDIWVCFETGLYCQAFTSVDRGPYAVLKCGLTQCKLIGWTD